MPSVTIPPIEELASRIVNTRSRELSKKINRHSRKNPILSDLGECDRQIVYGVTHWDKRQLHNVDLQARFDAGNIWEREIIRELEGLGFQVMLSQMPVEIKARDGGVLAAGKIDGMIRYEGKKYPFEIKTMNPNVYNQVHTIEDLNKKPWLRKYIRQLQMYLYGNEAEEGLFIFTNCLGAWNVMPVYVDFTECEVILQRLEKIHEHRRHNTLPERIRYQEPICGKCPFIAECLPDVENIGVEILDSKEMEAKLDRLHELAPLIYEHKELDTEIKTSAKSSEKDLIVGRYSIFVRKAQYTSYPVPPEIKKEYAVKTEIKRVKIVRNDT